MKHKLLVREQKIAKDLDGTRHLIEGGESSEFKLN